MNCLDLSSTGEFFSFLSLDFVFWVVFFGCLVLEKNGNLSDFFYMGFVLFV